ncbi:hypothetical protein HD806DRAFT_123157 [Xylariaceae sp. AK1471]|nr:hypothetical protein HD806DRAFT_123157 [Xylariaceae sp. AK1471]
MFTRPSSTLALAGLLLAGHATAKTDLAGCVSSETVAYGGASLIWYVPDSGEICAFLDCGGGRAPPKTTVPGCPSYDGTATYSPSFLPGFGDATTSAVPAATESLSASASASASEDFSGTDLTSLATITSPPVTTTATSSAAVETETETQTQGDSASSSSVAASSAAGSSAAGSSSDGAASGSSSQTSKSAGTSTTSTSTGGAAIPTAAVKGAFGVMAGLAAGVAMM